MNKQIIITASVFGVLAVISGAFAAHGLTDLITVKQLEVWDTAVHYHFYHVFALLFLSSFTRVKNNLIRATYYLFTFGIILFSGSLYLLACRDLIGWGWLKIAGPLTPVGGVLFIAGWITMGLVAYRNK